MVALSLRGIAHALGGEVAGAQVTCPGPRHSRRDRSLSVKIEGERLLIHSHAGDPYPVCRDHVYSLLGLTAARHRRDPWARVSPAVSREDDTDASREDARQIAVNVTGFFSALAEWSRPEQTVPVNDNDEALTADSRRMVVETAPSCDRGAPDHG